MAELARFDIQYHQSLDHQGQLHTALGTDTANAQNLLALYRSMLRTRLFDQKAVALQRTGRLGTYPSALGQEAIGAAIGALMRPEDVLVPYYREYAAQFAHGVSMAEILLYWGGDERGMDYQHAKQDLPICVPIASQACHAVGVAYAMQLRRQARVTVCVIGDGATSKGDFYEAINAAGVWQLPLVFVINNNQWAISLPRAQQSAAQTLAQKAIAAGIPGEQMDGNDVIGCVERIALAMTRARTGGGPALLEALSYRMCDHTTADDAGRYRSEQALQQQWRFDPISRLKTYLLAQQQTHEADLQALHNACAQEVEEQVDIYLNTPAQTPQSMFDFLYQQLPTALHAQRQQVTRDEVDDG